MSDSQPLTPPGSGDEFAPASEAVPPLDPDASPATDPSASELSEAESDKEIDALLAEAEALSQEATAVSEAAVPDLGAESTAAAAPGAATRTLSMPDFGGDVDTNEPLQPIDLLRDVGLHVKIELGRCRMLVEDVLRLAEGSIVELEKLAGDPVDIYANDRLVARGEVLVLNDNFCVRVNEIFSDVSQAFQVI